MKYFLSLIIALYAWILPAQDKKTVEALQIETPVRIDGMLDEQSYSQMKPAREFVQIKPYNGKPSFQPSEVYIFYDQTAIFVGAILYDSSPDSIYNFLSERDNIGSSDYFGIYFDPYNQGQVAYGFFVTPAGVQTDLKAVKSDHDYEDINWNAVWQSKTRITANGWIVEMRIPYSALRFPENGGGTWGLNMFRNIRRYNSNNSWNFVDREVSGFIHQEGLLTGIRNIKPPVRLSVSPYAATYYQTTRGNSSSDFLYKGGVDVKYGLSESFTLDMMLIPDFGQIQSDDQQLNLSPYELFYGEKRQFFTEGTELFDRAGIFYSRRIGASPRFSDKAHNSLSGNEIVDYNPSETQLLNATKVSGRTGKGLGIGLMNSMSLSSNAIIKDTVTGKERLVEIQPFTNYNVAVIDKTLKNNSYFSLINSNMLMDNNQLHANVTATDFQIRNKAKTYAFKGRGGFSTRKNGEQENGFFAELGFDKNSGKLQYGISQMINSDHYNPNDLGYLKRNNEMITACNISYNIIEPFSIFKEVHSMLWWNYNRVYKPFNLAGNLTGLNSYAQFKNNHWIQFQVHFSANSYNYYEPRVSGRYYFELPGIHPGLFYWTDELKPLSFFFAISGYKVLQTDQFATNGNMNLNLRVGKRYLFTYGISVSSEKNNRGFADMTESTDTIYFARRDIKTVSSVISTSYTINNKAGLNLRIRHYWSGVINKDYYQLQHNGSLINDPSYIAHSDENYNAFNIDLVFRWIFAPGSELTIAWKNSILDNQDIVTEKYWENLSRSWKSNQTNSLSLKILYYIDYNNIRRNS